MMTQQLKAGAPASPKFIEPRFKKDPWVTDEVLKSRGRSFDLFDRRVIQKLENPSLISSVHGRISRVLMTLPWWVFLLEAEDAHKFEPPIDQAEWESISATAASFQSILRLLPDDTRFVLLIHEKIVSDGTDFLDPAERLSRWLQELNMSARVEIIRARSNMGFTIWAEDAYAVSRDLVDSEVYFVEPASFSRGDDALIADLIAPKTDLEQTQVKLYFQGGNILIGDDFWLIGMDYPNNSIRLGYVVPSRGETPMEAVTKAYSGALDIERRFIAIGSRLPVPGFKDGALVREFQQNGETWTERLYFGNHEGTVQPLFHIDMFLTLAGRDTSDRYLVAVGDPRMAATVLGQELQPHAMAEVFDDIAEQLRSLDFRVVRTPLPLTYDDNEKEKVRTWYFATSNNALVQATKTERHIWLPTYGHRKWPELQATDIENRRIWEDLGFTVHQLGDFHPFAVNLGAAHCVKKYLSRE